MEKIFKLASDNPDQTIAISTLFASLVAAISILVACYSLWVQRRHNVLSVRPILHIDIGDYENMISVGLKNAGVGPLRVDAFTVHCSHHNRTTTTLIEQMIENDLDTIWTNFRSDLAGYWLEPGGELNLLRLEGDPEEIEFQASRDAARRALCRMDVRVSYSDIYSTRIATTSRKLGWFGRHFFYYDFKTDSLTFEEI